VELSFVIESLVGKRKEQTICFVLEQEMQGDLFIPESSLLEILSFATSHYATGMQLVVVCNYLSHVCNYKFGIV
jgi:hypothetical protein